MFLYVMPVMDPVVPTLDFMRQPFSESVTVELENTTLDTTLLDFPPTEPMLKSLCIVSWCLINGEKWGKKFRSLAVHQNKSSS